ncbi:MAG: nucleotide exchange factor GrpE [Desulfosudis oleivorans]|nr:nucleotide exchange factor GrpE [Desulfosudis oleivorans]
MRTSAEFENYKKRMAREMDEFRKYANQSLLQEMLSIVDHIELALQAAGCQRAPDEDHRPTGLSLTLKELHADPREVQRDARSRRPGKPFNPEVHEAILREHSGEPARKTPCVREMQKGYMINGRLLRPALVVVAAPGRGRPDQHDRGPAAPLNQSSRCI